MSGIQAGNVLVSMPVIHAIAVVDLEAERIVWGLRGGFRFQHQPAVLDSGRILFFDNLGTPKRSSVLEIDPATGQVRFATLFEVVRLPADFPLDWLEKSEVTR